MGQADDFVPLCDGWLVYADPGQDRVVVANAISGRVGAIYPLASSPGALALDTEGKLLYVALAEEQAVAVIDLLSGDVRTVAVPGETRSLALGPDGGLFIGVPLGNGYDSALYWLAAGAPTPVGVWPVRGNLMRWNAVRGELVTAARGSSVLARYGFEPAVGSTELQVVGAASNGQDLAVSDDGAHIAFAAGGGNGAGYTIFDFDAADIGSHRGEWVTGAYPRAVAFDPDSTRLVAANYGQILVFDVASFAQLAAYSPSYCSLSSVYRMGVSRGGRIAFGRQQCLVSSTYTYRFVWLSMP